MDKFIIEHKKIIESSTDVYFIDRLSDLPHFLETKTKKYSIHGFAIHKLHSIMEQLFDFSRKGGGG